MSSATNKQEVVLFRPGSFNDTSKAADDLRNHKAVIVNMENVDKAGIMNAIAEGIKTSTVERFRKQESPEGKKWKPSIRALVFPGMTLRMKGNTPEYVLENSSSLSFSAACQAGPKPGELMVRRSTAF